MKVIFIVGPTASGKSAVAVEIAKKINGEIISADSMQIYKHMNIGTAKISVGEMQGIKHHLIDFLEPNYEFSVATFKQLAEQSIEKIFLQNKTPIVCGGTGLYVDSLIKNIDFSQNSVDLEYREYLNDMLTKHGNEYLFNMLKANDPAAANTMHANNVKRVIRALEVMKTEGILFSEYKQNAVSKKCKFDFQIFGLNWSREVLYKRINLRVDQMMADGLLEETKHLLNNNYLTKGTAVQAIGYKELFKFINNEQTLQQAIDQTKRGTRHYAKRQMTWFKKNAAIDWIECDGKAFEQIVADISQRLDL